MSFVLAGLLTVAVALPHRLRLDHAAPAVAASIWGAALALRALMAVGLALFVVFWLPATTLFTLITHWCWHEVIPFVAVHLGLDGHSLGDAAVIVPAIIVAASLASMLFGLWLGARRVRRLVRYRAVGPGPRESVVIRDGEVMVAAAGLRRPRVVVSAGALVAFDDEELEMSLEHERGHIVRRHRFAVIAAQLCQAVARFLPGTRRATQEFLFHLERDADAFALRRRLDPAALASAICKSASPGPFGVAPATALTGTGPTTRRVQQLLEGGPAQHAASAGLRALAATMAALVIVTTVTLPLAVGTAPAAAGVTIHHCQP